MLTAETRNIIPKVQNYLKGKPVEKAWLFGSCSRGEETESSDIDILITFSENAHISLLTYAGYVCDLEQLLNRSVDLVEEGQLLPFAVANANRDKILIYERSN